MTCLSTGIYVDLKGSEGFDTEQAYPTDPTASSPVPHPMIQWRQASQQIEELSPRQLSALGVNRSKVCFTVGNKIVRLVDF